MCIIKIGGGSVNEAPAPAETGAGVKTSTPLHQKNPSAILREMQVLATALPFIQIGLAILLTATILLQQTGTGIGGAFGGSDNFSSGFHTRRGSEKLLFQASIVLAVLFALSAFIALII